MRSSSLYRSVTKIRDDSLSRILCKVHSFTVRYDYTITYDTPRIIEGSLPGKVAVSWLEILAASPNPTILIFKPRNCNFTVSLYGPPTNCYVAYTVIRRKIVFICSASYAAYTVITRKIGFM